MSSEQRKSERSAGIACRHANPGDANEITSLFLIRFPWLNHREDARANTRKNISQRIDDHNSITLVGHLGTRLVAVLRGQLESSGEFVIDAFCTDDSLDMHTRTHLAPAGFRLMLPILINFALGKGAIKVTFDTHIARLPSVVIRMIERLSLPMRYAKGDKTAHEFVLYNDRAKDSAEQPVVKGAPA